MGYRLYHKLAKDGAPATRPFSGRKKDSQEKATKNSSPQSGQKGVGPKEQGREGGWMLAICEEGHEPIAYDNGAAKYMAPKLKCPLCEAKAEIKRWEDADEVKDGK